ncbi:MAG TPA: ABC-F family ATP-binding cassette domain-containing protein, partial [Acidimicrobiales bacterium]|nr:ABC-F family ATP-binding cassette domain-containing protein [Acidimicrobiales bacterium]
MLQARELSVEVGGRLVVEGASLTIRARDKVGLVGRNGAGKTSLLRVLGGAAPAAAGVVHRHGALGYLPQDPRIAGLLDGVTALTHVLSGRGLDQATVRIEKLRLAMEEDHSEENVVRFTRAEEAFRAQGGYAAESEVRALVAGLGIEPDRVDLPLSVLSGGERRRVELARILFAGSDVLLLDEPTNHLDVDARSWLMKFLRTYRGALLVISHDLELLDESITRVLHLDRPTEEAPGHMVEYKGTYSQYVAARKKDEIRLAKVAAQQDAEIKRLTTLADKIRAKATLASKAHNLDKRADRIRAAHVEAPTHDRTLKVKLPPPPHTGRVVLEVNDASKSYDGPPVFTDVSFALERGERLLVLGLNGAGKTSLLRILAGEAIADSGSVEFGLGVSVGYYAQEHEGI